MPVVQPKEHIPSYPLLQATGKRSMIELREAKCVVSRPELHDFLVPHRKDFYMYVLVKSGSSRHWVDGVPYVLQPGTFYFSVPQQVHLKEETKPMAGHILCFTDEFLQLDENSTLRQLPIIQNQANGHELKLAPADVIFIENVMGKMLAEFEGDSAWRNPMLGSWLRVLVIYLSRLYVEQFAETDVPQEHSVTRDYQLLISRNYQNIHDVTTYAGMLNLSPGYLGDLVKQQSGKTAITHIHERLAVEAKRRLLHTKLSVKEIADELGFEDAAYFNRFFKRMTGTTPAAYRQQILEMYS